MAREDVVMCDSDLAAKLVTVTGWASRHIAASTAERDKCRLLFFHLPS